MNKLLIFILLPMLFTFTEPRANPLAESRVQDLFYYPTFDIQRAAVCSLSESGNQNCIIHIEKELFDTNFHKHPGLEEESDRKIALGIMGNLTKNSIKTFKKLLKQEENPYHYLVVEYVGRKCWKKKSERPLEPYLTTKNRLSLYKTLFRYVRKGLLNEISEVLNNTLKKNLMTDDFALILNNIANTSITPILPGLKALAKRLTDNNNTVDKELKSCLTYRLLQIDNKEITDMLKNRPMNNLQKTEKAKVKFANYNTFVMFDEHDNPYTNDDRLRGKRKQSLIDLAMQIKEIDADILVLQEVEKGEFLEDFNREYLKDMGYQVAIAETNDPRGYTVAILSRFPFEQTVNHHLKRFSIKEGEISFVRNLFEAEIIINNESVLIFTTHMQRSAVRKIYYKDHWQLVRHGLIKGVKQVIDKKVMRYQKAFNRDLNWVLAGDFNMNPDTDLYKLLVNDKESIKWMDLGAEVNKPEFTYSTKKPKMRIDYIFVSDSNRSGYVPNSFRVVKNSLAVKASDHFALTAMFKW